MLVLIKILLIVNIKRLAILAIFSIFRMKTGEALSLPEYMLALSHLKDYTGTRLRQII